MDDGDSDPDETPSDTPAAPAQKDNRDGLADDPERLRQAHGRYGDYLKKVGLPFEEEELDEDDARGETSPPDSSGSDALDDDGGGE